MTLLLVLFFQPQFIIKGEETLHITAFFHFITRNNHHDLLIYNQIYILTTSFIINMFSYYCQISFLDNNKICLKFNTLFFHWLMYIYTVNLYFYILTHCSFKNLIQSFKYGSSIIPMNVAVSVLTPYFPLYSIISSTYIFVFNLFCLPNL